MPFRPTSAPTRKVSAHRPTSAPNFCATGRPLSATTGRGITLSRSREKKGSRATFPKGPVDVAPQRVAPPFLPTHLQIAEVTSQPRPVDPLPDSDEETQGQEEVLTLTPRWTLDLRGSKHTEAKWWHVPDTQIQELVHNTTMEDSCTSLQAEHSAHKLLRSRSCPSSTSSTCRAMGHVGQLKKSAQLSATWALDSEQSDAVASRSGKLSSPSLPDALQNTIAGHVAPETFAVSSTLLRDIRLQDAISQGLTWPFQDRRPFDIATSPKRSWTDAHLLLSQTKSTSGGSAPLEQTKVDCLSGVTTPNTKTQRPANESRTGRNKLTKPLTRPSTPSGHSHASEQESDLIEVELAFYKNSDRICVLISSEARVGLDPSSSEPDKTTLKGIIAQLTGMPPSKQRLLCKGFDVSADQKTLRKVGISDGSTVTVYDKKDLKQSRNDVVLACTAKRLEKQQKLHQQDLRRASSLRESRREKKGMKIMPKWGWGIPADNSKTGSGYNDLGKLSSFRFENHHIWYDDLDDSGLLEIRSHQTYTEPLEYVSEGLPPTWAS